MNPWVLAHAAATWAMVGVIWTIQLLVYPSMSKVPSDAFGPYEQFHQRRVVAVLALFAVVEVVAAAAIALSVDGVPNWLSWSGGGLLVLIWVGTGAFYAPLHGRLADGFDVDLHRLLVQTNWLRTLAWTARGAIALQMIRATAT
jgi:hypothetical protein